MNPEIEFSIIVPVCHGGPFLEAALKSLALLNFPPERFEVIVAGPESDRELRRTIESNPSRGKIDLRYVGAAGSNKSSHLNAAISGSRGRILAFADDDCVVFPEWLVKIRSAFERDPEAGAVGGQDRTRTNQTSFDIALDYVLNSFLGTGGIRSRQGPAVGKYYPRLWNMAVTREAALSVSSPEAEGSPQVFNENLDVHEDVELMHRIERTGKRIVHAPEIVVEHSRDTTMRSFTTRSFKMARISRSIGTHGLAHACLTAFAVAFVLLLASSAVVERSRVPAAIMIGFYAGILALNALICFTRSTRPATLVWVPALLLALHFSRGIGYLFPWPEADLK